MYTRLLFLLAKLPRACVWALSIAHTAWHSHAVGQYLHVVEGTALVQEHGDKVHVLKPGDTIYTAPGVEHWHGATPDSFMVHLAIWEAPDSDGNEPETKWGKHLSDDEYPSVI
jgi:mannose-6-phosphate isomerase-like protein (cupin superfamily)